MCWSASRIDDVITENQAPNCQADVIEQPPENPLAGQKSACAIGLACQARPHQFRLADPLASPHSPKLLWPLWPCNRRGAAVRPHQRHKKPPFAGRGLEVKAWLEPTGFDSLVGSADEGRDQSRGASAEAQVQREL